jgi:hypothetical protein
MSSAVGEICPSCKLRNKPGAILCTFCGAPLSGPQQDTRQTDRLDEEENIPAGKFEANVSLVPDIGLGLYLENSTPVTIIDQEEATLGRKASDSGGLIIDLVPFDAIQMGVSRRHAMIRREDEGYKLIDLDSTNGTWINGQRLTPYKPYQLTSGDVIRLSRLNLLVLYRK